MCLYYTHLGTVVNGLRNGMVCSLMHSNWLTYYDCSFRPSNNSKTNECKTSLLFPHTLWECTTICYWLRFTCFATLFVNHSIYSKNTYNCLFQTCHVMLSAIYALSVPDNQRLQHLLMTHLYILGFVDIAANCFIRIYNSHVMPIRYDGW